MEVQQFGQPTNERLGTALSNRLAVPALLDAGAFTNRDIDNYVRNSAPHHTARRPKTGVTISMTVLCLKFATQVSQYVVWIGCCLGSRFCQVVA